MTEREYREMKRVMKTYPQILILIPLLKLLNAWPSVMLSCGMRSAHCVLYVPPRIKQSGTC